MLDAFRPGEVWPDTDGNPINAHGGGVLFHEGVYYWFGEHKAAGRGGNVADLGIRCYGSRDLFNWTNEGIALSTVDEAGHPLEPGCVMERPKVLFNAKTGTFVMWLHNELKGQGYNAARSAVAVADRPQGPYRFLESFRPNGTMARDMTLFQDVDGRAYHYFASDDNQTMIVAELSDDYRRPTGQYVRIFPNRLMEAPAVFRRSDGTYFLVASGCTGWAPNEARSASAKGPFGYWAELGNPCLGDGAELTFGGQSTFVLPVQGRTDAFIFMADVWKPDNQIDSRYVWLPVEFRKNRFFIRWRERWDLSAFDGQPGLEGSAPT